MKDIYGTVIKDMKGKGLLTEEGDFIKLTKRGIDVSNYVTVAALIGYAVWELLKIALITTTGGASHINLTNLFICGGA